MPIRRRPLTLLFPLLLPATTAGALFAQSNSEINAGIQFNFTPPGARSLSLGGAFLALADDATAAYTNPAGLINLSRPEVAMEGRVSQFTNTYLWGGRGGGTLSNLGVDTVNHEIDHSDKNPTRGLSFLSLVYPGGAWAIAIYRHELANFKASATTQGAFLGRTADQGITFEGRFNPTISTLDLKIVNYGLAGAFHVGESLSLGLGVSQSDYHQNSHVTRYAFVDAEEPTYITPVERDGTHGEDFALAVNAGLLWKITPQIALGAVYRQGPRFHADAFDQEDLSLPLTSVCVSPEVGPNRTCSATFHVPDVYGAGLSFAPVRSLTISFDYDRVRYSQLGSSTVDVFQQGSTYTIDDASEYHAGAQYLFQFGMSSFALRAGAWREPSHSLVATFVDISATDNLDTVVRKTLNKLLFHEGARKTHYTGGAGIAIGEHFQLDAGADYAKERATIGSLSFVVRL